MHGMVMLLLLYDYVYHWNLQSESEENVDEGFIVNLLVRIHVQEDIRQQILSWVWEKTLNHDS